MENCNDDNTCEISVCTPLWAVNVIPFEISNWGPISEDYWYVFQSLGAINI